MYKSIGRRTVQTHELAHAELIRIEPDTRLMRA
jgi:hypothetical protein